MRVSSRFRGIVPAISLLKPRHDMIAPSWFRTYAAAVALVLAIVSAATAQYSGGSGTADNPYEIGTAADLIALGETPEDWGKHFKLTTDVDLGEHVGGQFDIIGTYGTPFTGVFDGSGCIISGLSISRNSDPVGVFGYVNDPNAQIRDLGLVDPLVDAEHGSYVGALIGSLRAGTVSNCYAKGGSVSGDRYVGGLVGLNRGTIVTCYSTAVVTGDYGVGGLTGQNEGYIADCWSSSNVSGGSAVGGICGENWAAMDRCWATGTVSGANSGGLVGINRPEATISGCYSQGDVSGQRYVGGLAAQNRGKIVTCYSAGSVTGAIDVGGLVGRDDNGRVYSSFWDIQVSGQTVSAGGWGKTTAEMQTAYTFAGWGRGSIWTISEGTDYPRLAWQHMPGAIVTTIYGGGIGTPDDPYLICTPEQLDEIGVYPEDWDKHFKLMEDLDLTGVRVNPIAHWSPDAEGEAFEGVFDGNGKSIAGFTSPIASSGLFDYVSGSCAEIGNLTLIDPNVRGSVVGPLVGHLQEGSVRDCTVIRGSVSGGTVGGLIGSVKYGVVEKCAVVDGTVWGSYAGGLIGSVRYGVVENCYSSAIVAGGHDLGGLVGFCADYALIRNCEAIGSVQGTDYNVGGLVGNSDRDSVISGSFATGDVSGNSQVGGLVGSLYLSRIVCCYAAGSVSGQDSIGGLFAAVMGSYILDSYAVGQVNGTGKAVGGLSYDPIRGFAADCFWDAETSGTSTSGVGIGLTTIEMRDPNTFISAGWDFVGESANGPSDIWIMPEGGGYPILSWQTSPLPPRPGFSGGTGEPNDPFVISTPEELNSIGHNPRLMSVHFRLARDIDLAGLDFFTIGSEGFPFAGVFDGDGHAISNFSHEASRKCSKYVGLFRYLRGSKAEIRNLVLSRSCVLNEVDLNPGDEDNVGSLVGLLLDGAVVNCHVEDGVVSVKDSVYVGGLIGWNTYGIVEKCTSTVTMTGSSDLGGIVGCNRAGVIRDCHSLNSVLDGYLRVGGIAGSNWALVMDCSASGNVKGWRLVGGLVGWNLNTIAESCSRADVVGTARGGSVGGLVGENLGSISDCYARGSVSGDDCVGGLVGDNTYHPNIAGSIATSYSTGRVVGTGNVGGLVHRGSSAATTSDDCFWDIQASGQTISDGGVGKTIVEMQTPKTFLDAGWDFAGETVNGTDDIWWILEGQDYPRLWWELGDEAP